MTFISKRWLINYLLIILIVIFTVIGNRYNVETGYKPENRITRLKPEDINRVSIQTADETIDFIRAAGQWQIASPIQWLANNVSIERILGIVASETESRLSTSEIDLGTVGLQMPKAMLTLNDTSIFFGDTNNIGKRRYLRIDSTVYLLDDIYLPLLTQGIHGFVDQRLLPRALALSQLKLGRLEISRTPNAGWQDSDNRFTPDQLNRLVTHWQTQPATHIREYQKASAPQQKIIATLENAIQIEFFLMSINPEIIIARPDLGLQYHFDKDQYYNLLAVKTDESS